jgi:DNA-directed RNA polymerase specialized sigma24 family protein
MSIFSDLERFAEEQEELDDHSRHFFPKTPMDYSGVTITVLPAVKVKPGILSHEGRGSFVSLGNCGWLPDSCDPFTQKSIDTADRDNRIRKVVAKAQQQYPTVTSIDGEALTDAAIAFVDGNTHLAKIAAPQIQENPEEYPEIMDMVWARLGGKVTESQAVKPLTEGKLEAMTQKVSALSESDASTLYLVENHKKSMKKIADIVGCSDQTIGNLVEKWKQMLADRLASKQEELPLPELAKPINRVTVYDQTDDLEALLKPRQFRSNAGRKTLAEGARIAAEKAAIAARQGSLSLF